METQLNLQVDLLERGTYQNLADLKEQIMLFAKQLFNDEDDELEQEELAEDEDETEDGENLSNRNYSKSEDSEEGLEDDEYSEKASDSDAMDEEDELGERIETDEDTTDEDELDHSRM